MKIRKEVLSEIVHTIPFVPPETGGLIGGTDGIITCYVLDTGSALSNGYDIYAPDTSFLNRTIQQWNRQSINLYGLFHSHFPCGTRLSGEDEKYIGKIMRALPKHIDHLYFPIVLPREKMIVYRADRFDEHIMIVSEDIETL